MNTLAVRTRCVFVAAQDHMLLMAVNDTRSRLICIVDAPDQSRQIVPKKKTKHMQTQQLCTGKGRRASLVELLERTAKERIICKRDKERPAKWRCVEGILSHCILRERLGFQEENPKHTNIRSG